MCQDEKENNLFQHKKQQREGTAEVAKWLRVIAALVEDSLGLGTQGPQLPVTHAPWNPIYFSGCCYTHMT